MKEGENKKGRCAMSEKDTLQALRNRLINFISVREREISKAREALKATQTITTFSEEGIEGLIGESEPVNREPAVESGPTGRELVLGAISDFTADEPGKEFQGADLSKIIRAKGLWKKKTPLANMVFMTLKRLVEQGDILETKDGYKAKPELRLPKTSDQHLSLSGEG